MRGNEVNAFVSRNREYVADLSSFHRYKIFYLLLKKLFSNVIEVLKNNPEFFQIL